MGRMLLTKAAVFTELHLIRSILLVFGGCIVPLLALSTTKGDNVTHDAYLLNPFSP